jgi:hypothetical protein
MRLWRAAMLAAMTRPAARPIGRGLHRLQTAQSQAGVRGRSRGRELVLASTQSLEALADDLQLNVILSPANAKIKLMRRLGSRRQRERAGMILLEGHRLVADAIEAGVR